MRILGITGGIGMGKSTVAEMLRQRGLPVVDTDVLARQVVEPGQPALAELVAAFGPEMLDEQGRLRRDRLAAVVFSQRRARRQLEAILHPRIRQAWQAQAALWRREGCPVCAVIIPLLYETQAAPEFDQVICVACTARTQRRRLLERGWTPLQIRQRLRAQWPIQQKLALARFVVWTEGRLPATEAQITQLLHNFCKPGGGTIAGPVPRCCGMI